MKSYFFYYFSAAPGEIPYFEAVDCYDDADAAQRCSKMLADRHKCSAEVWRDDKLICRVEAANAMGGAAASAAAA